MTLLLLPFLDGITEAERSKVTFLSSSETQRRKYPCLLSLSILFIWLQSLLLAAIMDYLNLALEILGFQ